MHITKPVENKADAGVRLDRWLWAARFFKTRSLARQAIEGGRVDVNDADGKPSRLLIVGDRLRVSRGEEHFEIDIVALATLRGPASVAQTLYEETEASAIARAAHRERRRIGSSGFAQSPARPNKKSRRLIRSFKESL